MEHMGTKKKRRLDSLIKGASVYLDDSSAVFFFNPVL